MEEANILRRCRCLDSIGRAGDEHRVGFSRNELRIGTKNSNSGSGRDAIVNLINDSLIRVQRQAELLLLQHHKLPPDRFLSFRWAAIES